MALWGGRFEGGPAEEMQAFSESLSVDLEMVDEDIEASLAHVTMLGEAGLVPAAEVEVLRQGLVKVREELATGAYHPGVEREDIHMAVEARLTELVGEAGGRLHTARSRNDQVATDVRLWLKRRLTALDGALDRLIKVLLQRVEGDGRALLPGFTHLQRGQPIWLGHHLLAHAWHLLRDRGRGRDARTRADLCPLGAGAMAGTPHPIDRGRTAEILGFRGLVPNAMDAVSARDHEMEAASAGAIRWSTSRAWPRNWCCGPAPSSPSCAWERPGPPGHSIMPQKRNPDAAELVRGKSGRVLGDLQALMVMTKGLPLAYNRDLQEDRHALFDAMSTTLSCVRVMAGMWESLEVRRERYAQALEGDFLLATELADHLVERGVPFREAHHAAGRLVAWCEARGGDFRLLTPEILQQHHPSFGPESLAVLDPVAAVERRGSAGGTAWAQVEVQVAALKEALG